MFNNKPNDSEEVGRDFEVPVRDKGREQFFDSTDKKVFDTNVHREYLGYKLLLDINLEERRGKLRRLLEDNENTLTDEHLSKIETLETRVKNLKEHAIRIRRQTELERQILADTKRNQATRLNDDQLRRKQGLDHFGVIVEDWDKLKEIKSRIKREENCEKKFWLTKQAEMINDLIEKENIIKRKHDSVKNDFREQIDMREKQRQLDKAEKAENQKRINEIAIEIDKQLADEDLQSKKDKAMNQQKYHQLLDKQLEIKKSINDRNKSFEDSFDVIMSDENLQKLKDANFKSQIAVKNNFKSLTNFMNYQNCINKQKIEEEKEINDKVQKTQIEIHRKNYEIEKEKVKKFAKLIADIKNAQKDQLIEARKVKDLLKEEKIKDRKFANKIYEESLKEDQIKLEKLRKEQENYLQSLKQQLVFNENLKIFQKSERERERKSMREAEENYIQKIEDIRSKEQLQFIHPWRAN